MITNDDLTQADAVAQAAQEERERVDAELANDPHSQRAASAAVKATQAAAQAGARARRLREEFEAQEAAKRDDRADLEKGAAKEIQAAGRDLAAAHGRVVASATAAQGALLDLAVAGSAFNAAVAEHAGLLAVLGVDLDGGESGGGRELGGYVVKVAGRSYLPAEPGALLGHVVARVAALLPDAPRLAVAARYLPSTSRAAALLDGVALPTEDALQGGRMPLRRRKQAA